MEMKEYMIQFQNSRESALQEAVAQSMLPREGLNDWNTSELLADMPQDNFGW